MNFIIALFIIVAGIANAQTRSVVCSNANGSVTLGIYDTSVKENKDLNYARITVKGTTLMGKQEIKMNMKDLNYVLAAKQVLDSKKTSTNTACNIPVKTVSETYIENVYFAKVDGSAILQDDTPQSTLTSVTETMLCKSSVTEAWPCK